MNGNDIRNKRKELGLTQKELATILGVSHNTIGNWEKGEVIPQSKEKLINNFLKNNIGYENKSQNDDLLILNEEVSTYRGVPYYDVDFTASFLEVENNQQVKPDSYINHPFFKGCDYVVRASGQSMAKVISHGDAIGLIKVENWKEFFPFGEIYAIVTDDGFRMIKVITAGKDEDSYTLISKPTDGKKDEFPPQQIKKDKIISIFKVQASSHLF